MGITVCPFIYVHPRNKWRDHSQLHLDGEIYARPTILLSETARFMSFAEGIQKWNQ